MGRMERESSLVILRIISEQSFSQGTKFLQKIFPDIIVRRQRFHETEKLVLWPTKVSTDEVVELEIVRSIKSSQQSDCLPGDIDMRSALRLCQATLRTPSWS